jgi:hypothetical protein
MNDHGRTSTRACVQMLPCLHAQSLTQVQCALLFETRVQGKAVLRSILQTELPLVLILDKFLESRCLHGDIEEPLWDANNCKCRWCRQRSEKLTDTTNAMSFVDLSSNSIWSILVRDLAPLGDANDGSPELFMVSRYFLPGQEARTAVFEMILRATVTRNRSRPEIAFHRYNTGLPGAGAIGQDPQPMFDQLCDSFIKSRLHVRAASLRGEVEAVTWKTVLGGALNQGAAGLPGPFRQAISEICGDLTKAARVSAGEGEEDAGSVCGALFIPCPNSRSNTGSNRNKLILNPKFCGVAELDCCRVLGQLLGVAIRSKCCLDLDLAEGFWKSVLSYQLVASDLKSIDYTGVPLPPSFSLLLLIITSTLLHVPSLPSIPLQFCSLASLYARSLTLSLSFSFSSSPLHTYPPSPAPPSFRRQPFPNSLSKSKYNQAFPLAAWQGFQFADPSGGVLFNEEDFNEYFSELTYTIILSDGSTHKVVCTRMHTSTHIHIYARAYIDGHTHAHTRTHTPYTRTHTHSHAHINMDIHTPMHSTNALAPFSSRKAAPPSTSNSMIAGLTRVWQSKHGADFFAHSSLGDRGLIVYVASTGSKRVRCRWNAFARASILSCLGAQPSCCLPLSWSYLCAVTSPST